MYHLHSSSFKYLILIIMIKRLMTKVLVSEMTLVSGLERKISFRQQFILVPHTDNHDNEINENAGEEDIISTAVPSSTSY